MLICNSKEVGTMDKKHSMAGPDTLVVDIDIGKLFHFVTFTVDGEPMQTFGSLMRDADMLPPPTRRTDNSPAYL
jgi:hypothetical protein